jgi:hypothetical protein
MDDQVRSRCWSPGAQSVFVSVEVGHGASAGRRVSSRSPIRIATASSPQGPAGAPPAGGSTGHPGPLPSPSAGPDRCCWVSSGPDRPGPLPYSSPGSRSTSTLHCAASSPVSSASSRRAAVSGCSPGLSHSPAGSSQMYCWKGCRYCLISNTRCRSSMATTATESTCSTISRSASDPSGSITVSTRTDTICRCITVRCGPLHTPSDLPLVVAG